MEDFGLGIWIVVLVLLVFGVAHTPRHKIERFDPNVTIKEKTYD